MKNFKSIIINTEIEIKNVYTENDLNWNISDERADARHQFKITLGLNSNNTIWKEGIKLISVGTTNFSRKAEENNYGCSIAVVDHSFNKKNGESRSPLQGFWEAIVDKGLFVNGEKFVPLLATPSGLRQAQTIFIKENLKKDIRWRYIPADMSRLEISKQSQYLGMALFSTTRSFEESIGENIPAPSIQKTAIFNEKIIEKEIYSVVMNGIKREIGNHVVPEKIFDGAALQLVDDEIIEENPPKSWLYTARHSGVKACVLIIKKSSFVKIMKEAKVKTFKDACGHIWSEKKLPDLLGTKSIFKLSKCIGELEFDNYTKRVEENGLKTLVCLTEHLKRAHVPSQVMQSLEIGIEDAKKLADMSASKLNNLKKAVNMHRLIGGAYGAAVKMLPILSIDSFTENLWSKGFNSLLHETKGGTLLYEGEYHFAFPDPVAMIKYFIGAPVEGVINPGEGVCKDLMEAKVATYRFPNNDNNASIMKLINIDEKYKDLFQGHAIYFSIMDKEMTLKQMDFDGDKVLIIKKGILVDLIEKSIEKQGTAPLVLSDLKVGEKKDLYTYGDFKRLIKTIVPAPIGLLSNGAKKLWISKTQKTEEDYGLIYKLSELSTLAIDMAKALCGGIDATDAEELIRNFSPEVAEVMFNKESEFARMRMPRSHAYAKTAWNDMKGLEMKISSTKYYAGNGMELYSKMVPELVGDTKPEITAKFFDKLGRNKAIKILGEMLLDRSIPLKVIVGIIKEGVDYDTSGLFDKLVSDKIAHFKEDVGNGGDILAFGENEKLRIRMIIREYSENRGFTLTQAINALVAGLYLNRADTNSAWMPKQTLWEVFGEELLENLRKNLHQEKNLIAELVEKYTKGDELDYNDMVAKFDNLGDLFSEGGVSDEDLPVMCDDEGFIVAYDDAGLPECYEEYGME